MAEICLHCGAELAMAHDGSCPACRRMFDDGAAKLPGWEDHRPPPRPLGIAILAILLLVGSILFGVLQVFMLSKVGDLEVPFRRLGLGMAYFFISAGFLAIFGAAAGVGMWLGKKWGWWLGAFYQVYGVARNASTLITLTGLADELANTTRGPAYYYAKHTGRIIVHLLILLYFFKGNVLAYFDLEDISKQQALSKMLWTCAAIMAAASAVAKFAR